MTMDFSLSLVNIASNVMTQATMIRMGMERSINQILVLRLIGMARSEDRCSL